MDCRGEERGPSGGYSLLKGRMNVSGKIKTESYVVQVQIYGRRQHNPLPWCLSSAQKCLLLDNHKSGERRLKKKKRDKEFEMVSVRKAGFGMWFAGLQNHYLSRVSSYRPNNRQKFDLCYMLILRKESSYPSCTLSPRLAVRKQNIKVCYPHWRKNTISFNSIILFCIVVLIRSCSGN